MVYLGGDNNLSEEMVYALKSMYSVGSTPKCKIFALFDAGLSPVVFPIPTRQDRRAFLRKHAHGQDADAFTQNTFLLGGPVSENDGLLRKAGELRSRETISKAGQVTPVQAMLEEF